MMTNDDNEVGSPPSSPFNPSTKHKVYGRSRRQQRRPQCGTESHK